MTFTPEILVYIKDNMDNDNVYTQAFRRIIVTYNEIIEICIFRNENQSLK